MTSLFPDYQQGDRVLVGRTGEPGTIAEVLPPDQVNTTYRYRVLMDAGYDFTGPATVLQPEGAAP